jgi:hypothetical protein
MATLPELSPNRRWPLQDILALAAFAALSFLYFLPLWSAKQAWCGTDFDVQILPLYHWLHLKYASGQLPLWSDQLQAGYPFLDESVTGFFYLPRHLIQHFLDVFPALALDMALHTYIAGVGAFAFCRLRGLRTSAASLAAIVSMFGGGMAFAQHAPWIHADMAWLPWQLVAVELALRPGRALAGAGLLGLATGFSVLGGHATFILLAGLVTLLYATGRAYATGQKGWRIALVASLMAAIVALMGWGHFRTALRGMSQSVRARPFPTEEAGLNALSPASLIHPILPYAFGDPRDSTFLGMNWPGGTWIHQGLFLYLSLGALLLAMYGIWRRKESRLLACIALALLGLSLGTRLPFFGLLHALPGFSHVRAPGKWLILATFPMGAAAAWGLDSLLETPKAARRWCFLCLALALLLGGLWAESRFNGEAWVGHAVAWMHERLGRRADASSQLVLWHGAMEALNARLQSHLAMQALFMAATGSLFFLSSRLKSKRVIAGLWLSICLADLFINTFAYFPSTDTRVYTQAPPTLDFLQGREALDGPFRFFAWGGQELLTQAEESGWAPGAPQRESILEELVPGDMPVFFEACALRGYPALELRRSDLLLNGLRDTTFFPKPGEREEALLSRRCLFDRGAAKYFFASKPLLQDGLKPLAKTKHLIIYLNEHAKPMAWPASEAVDAMGMETATARVLSEPWASQRAFVESGRSGISDSHATLRWIERSDEAWDLAVSSRRDTFIVLSRTPYRGLNHALVDGREVPWQETDGAYCGAWVPAGSHRLRMQISDPLLQRDMALCASGYVMALLLMGWGLMKKAAGPNGLGATAA